jgi:DNA modification methylase
MIRKGNKNPSILHLFSGNSKIGDIRVDIWEGENVTHNIKVLDYLKELSDESFDVIIADPPYNSKFDSKYGSDFYVGGDTKKTSKLKAEILRTVKPGGIIIFKHWFDFSPNSIAFEEIGVHFTSYGGYMRITITSAWRKHQNLDKFLDQEFD